MESDSKKPEQEKNKTETQWDALKEWGKKNPFEVLAERRKQRDLARKAAGFDNTLYAPSGEEMMEFDSVRGTPAYEKYDKKYKRRSKKDSAKDLLVVERNEKRYPEIFSPKKDEIELTTKPYIEAIHEHFGRLIEIGSDYEKNADVQASASALIDFFSEQYQLDEKPIPLIYSDSREKKGGSHDILGFVSINEENIRSYDDLLGLVSHELWHARQREHRFDNPLYQKNLDMYVQASVDKKKYREQLVEKEAYYIEEQVRGAYIRNDLREHPEKMVEARGEFQRWLLQGYGPDGYKPTIHSHRIAIAGQETVKEGFLEDDEAFSTFDYRKFLDRCKDVIIKNKRQ